MKDPICEINLKKVDKIVSDTINYCYFDISESERALIAVAIKTMHKAELEDIAGMMDCEMPELFLRKRFTELLFEARIKQDYPFLNV